MNSTQLMNLYEAIQTTTKKMVAAAQNGEWEKLVKLEEGCRLLTNELINNEVEIFLSDELQQKKIRIIHQVLDDDARIRSYTEPQMEKLHAILSTQKQKNKLQQAYTIDSA